MNEKTMKKPAEPVKTVKKVKAEASMDAAKLVWKDRLLSIEHWKRFVLMVLFLVITGVAAYIMMVLILLQFVWGLVAGEGNDKLRFFGNSLSHYIYQMLRFLTYNTEDKPFPFADWPDGDN